MFFFAELSWKRSALLLGWLGLAWSGGAAASPVEDRLAIDNPCAWPEVECRVRRLDQGGSIRMTSPSAGQVAKLRARARRMAQEKKCSRPENGEDAGAEMMVGCPSAWPGVKTRMQEIPSGAVLTWTSADPGLAASIQEHLARMAGMKHISRHLPASGRKTLSPDLLPPGQDIRRD